MNPLYVGIDVSSKTNVVYLMKPDGSKISNFSVANSRDGSKQLVRHIVSAVEDHSLGEVYNEPINQDKKLKKISDLDIMKIRKKKKWRSKLWESEQHIQQSTRAK